MQNYLARRVCEKRDTHTRQTSHTGGKWCKNYDTGAENKGRRLRLLERVPVTEREGFPAVVPGCVEQKERDWRCACARHIVMFETLTACQYYYKRVHQSDASSQCKLCTTAAPRYRTLSFAFF